MMPVADPGPEHDRHRVEAGEHVGFDGVIGHREIVAFLRAEMAAPGHAYLFTGAASVGKATVARDFARLLLCPEGGAHEEPCRSCRRVASGNHPDLISVEPEGRTSLGVDQARGVVSQAVLSPVESPRRVFLFEDAGLMTEQAANTLLKTLEEPTAPVIFLLVAESEDDFPPTIASRCRTVHFGRVPDEELTAGAGRSRDRGRRGQGGGDGGRRKARTCSGAGDPTGSGPGSTGLAVAARAGDGPSRRRLCARRGDAVHARALGCGSRRRRGTAEGRDRAKKRATQSLLAGGLEILASFYADGASLQLGGPIRNRDVPLPALTSVPPAKAVANAQLVLDAVVDLAGNLRATPVLASLFAALGSE